MELKSFVSHWPPQRWQEYEPLLNYGHDNVVRLVAYGTLFKVLRTVQADGIRGISKAERKAYAHPAGSGFTSISCKPSKEINFPTQSIPFGPSSYLSAQAKVVSDNFTSYYKWRSYRNAGGGDWCKPCCLWIKRYWSTIKNCKKDAKEKSNRYIVGYQQWLLAVNSFEFGHHVSGNFGRVCVG